MAFLRSSLLVLALASPAFALSSVSGSERGMTKVVKLLQEMQETLEKEQKADEDIYDKMSCWCEANDKLKTKAIADAEQHSLDLEASINELAGRTSALSTKVSQLEEEIASGESALATATAIREKEAAEFHQSEKDSIQAITGLKSAVHVFSGQHGDALAQQNALLQVRHLFQGKSDTSLRRFGLAAHQRRVVASLLQQPVAASSYAPASGEIYGVLNSMKESFETKYENAKVEEGSAKDGYASLKAAKDRELAAAREQHEAKKSALADADENLASDRTDMRDTTKQLEADRYFLADLKDRCSKMDEEWDARSKVRTDEMTAVSQAIEILNDDDAKDTFQRSTGASFVQIARASSDEASVRRAQVLLRKAAVKLGKPELAAIAMKEDVFAGLKANMDKMITTLKNDQQAEVEEKDACRQDLHDTSFEMESRYRDKSDLETKIEDLTALQGRLTDTLQASKDEMASTRSEMKKASADRAKENANFLASVADQRTTQELLEAALKKLSDFYNKASLVQQRQGQPSPAGEEMPAGFAPYKKSSGNLGVMEMIRNILKDSENAELDITRNEQESQTGYEEFIRDSNAEVKALQAKIADLGEQLAQCKGDLTQANADLLATGQMLEDLNQQKTDIEFRCHHVLKYFEQRQAARIEEIDALNAAKAVMSQA